MLPLNEQLAVTLLAWSALPLTAFFWLEASPHTGCGATKTTLIAELVHAELRKPNADNAAFPAACHMQKQSVAENRSTSARREVST